MRSLYFAAAMAAVALADVVTVDDVQSLHAVALQFIALFDTSDPQDQILVKSDVATIRTYIKETYNVDIWDYAVLTKRGVQQAMNDLAVEEDKVSEYNAMATFFNLAGEDSDVDGHTMTRQEAINASFDLLTLAIKGDADFDGSVSHAEIDSFTNDPDERAVTEDVKTMAKGMGDDQELTINDTLRAAKTLLIQNRQQHSVVGAEDTQVTRLELFFRTLQDHLDDEDLLVRGDAGNTALTM